jgi:tRNA pseudouridine55 synthase
MTPGIHLIHKPPGPTSFSIVKSFRDDRTTASSKKLSVCHGGTLDPFAHGLLLILVQPATQLFDFLHDVPKIYEATIRWGIETENGDLFGASVSNSDASSLSETMLADAIRPFIGWHEQVPHATSAMRVDGERAYVRAHRGEHVDMPAKRVYLHEAMWLDHDLPMRSTLRVVVRGGFYVRAFVRDLGRAVGCGAHIEALRRTAIGPWNDPGPMQQEMITGPSMLPWAAKRVLSDANVGDLRQGRTIPIGAIEAPEWRVPDGFPEPDPPIRGVHLDRLGYLLRSECGALRLVAGLRG